MEAALLIRLFLPGEPVQSEIRRKRMQGKEGFGKGCPAAQSTLEVGLLEGPDGLVQPVSKSLLGYLVLAKLVFNLDSHHHQ